MKKKLSFNASHETPGRKRAAEAIDQITYLNYTVFVLDNTAPHLVEMGET